MLRIFRGKRGIAEGVNVMRILILFVVIAIPLTSFAITFNKAGKASGDIEACRLSIIAATETKLASQLSTGGPLAINCPYSTVKVKKKDVTKGGKVDWALLNGKIARQLYECYVKTAGGKKNPYSSKNTGEGDSFCLVCSRMDFSEINDSELVGFKLYMAAKRIPGEKMTFYEATMGKTVDADLLRLFRSQAESGTDVYRLDQPYVVVWRMSTFDAWSTIAKITATTTAGGATLGAPGGPIGVGIGAAAGAVGGFVGGVIGWAVTDDKMSSEHLIMPEAALSANLGEILGDNIPEGRKITKDTPVCDRLIDMRRD